MRTINDGTKTTMRNRRNFVNYATMTLSDGTVLELKPADFRLAGNSFTDDMVDGSSFQVGSAIGKTVTITLDNTDNREEIIDEESKTNRGSYSPEEVYEYEDYVFYKGEKWECVGDSISGEEPTEDSPYWQILPTIIYPHGKFSEYDFYMSYFTLYLVLHDAYTDDEGIVRDEKLRIGKFTVITPSTRGAVIEITGVDNMHLFDRNYDESAIDYTLGVSLQQILVNCCMECKVPIGFTRFPNDNYIVYEKPQGVTYRQIISYVAQIAGSNLKIGNTGALTFAWYDMSALKEGQLDGGTFAFNDGDEADGGLFEPWTTGDMYDGGDFTSTSYHDLFEISDLSIGTDDIQFTGVHIKSNDYELHYPDDEGWDTYYLDVSDNPFVVGHEPEIAVHLYERLADLKFRTFSCSTLQDPTIESGDPALVWDVKGNSYFTIITNVVYNTGGYTEISCNAEDPIAKTSTYINPAAQAAQAANKNLRDYSGQVAHFNELASEALGYYRTEVKDESTGGIVSYIHDMPTLENSTVIWKITADGIFISEDGGESYNAGVDASTGTMLMNLVYSHGIVCDWIKSGTLTLGEDENIAGKCEVYTMANEKIIQIDNSGINAPAFNYDRSKCNVSIANGSISMITDSEHYLRLNHSSGTPWISLAGNICQANSGSQTFNCRSYDIIHAGELAAQGSDINIKDDISNIDSDYAHKLIDNVTPVSFKYKPDKAQFMGEDYHYGVIAQDVRHALDDICKDDRDLAIEHQNTDYRQVDYKEFIAPMIKYIQDLQSQICALKFEVEELKTVVKNTK